MTLQFLWLILSVTFHTANRILLYSEKALMLAFIQNSPLHIPVAYLVQRQHSLCKIFTERKHARADAKSVKLNVKI